MCSCDLPPQETQACLNQQTAIQGDYLACVGTCTAGLLCDDSTAPTDCLQKIQACLASCFSSAEAALLGLVGAYCGDDDEEPCGLTTASCAADCKGPPDLDTCECGEALQCCKTQDQCTALGPTYILDTELCDCVVQKVPCRKTIADCLREGVVNPIIDDDCNCQSPNTCPLTVTQCQDQLGKTDVSVIGTDENCYCQDNNPCSSFTCPDGQVTLLVDLRCICGCGAGTIADADGNCVNDCGPGTPLDCTGGQTWNNDDCQCECPTGQILQGGQCTDTTTEDCPEGRVRSVEGGDCVCSDGLVEGPGGECIAESVTCGDNQIKCRENCIPDCTRCQALNPETCVCEDPACTGGMVLDGSGCCVCPDGLVPDTNGECVPDDPCDGIPVDPCFTLIIDSNNECSQAPTCLSGESCFGGECVTDPDCNQLGPGFTPALDVQGKPVCQAVCPGQVYVGGDVQCRDACPAGTAWNGTECVEDEDSSGEVAQPEEPVAAECRAGTIKNAEGFCIPIQGPSVAPVYNIRFDPDSDETKFPGYRPTPITHPLPDQFPRRPVNLTILYTEHRDALTPAERKSIEVWWQMARSHGDQIITG